MQGDKQDRLQQAVGFLKVKILAFYLNDKYVVMLGDIGMGALNTATTQNK